MADILEKMIKETEVKTKKEKKPDEVQ